MHAQDVLALDSQPPAPNSLPILDVLDASDCGLVVLDEDASVLHWNTWMATRSGFNREQAFDARLEVLFPEIENSRLTRSIDQALRKGLSSVLSPRLHKHLLPLYGDTKARLKNDRLHQSVSVKPIQIEHAPRCCLLQITDVTATVLRERTLRDQASELKTLMQEFQVSESRLRSILESTQDGVFTVGEDGIIDSINPAAEKIFQICNDAALGQRLDVLIPDLCPAQRPSEILNGLLELANKTTTSPVEVEAIRQHCRFPLELSIGEVNIGEHRVFVGGMRDITDRKRTQEHIEHLAHYDVLTDLPNRALFQLRLDQAIREAERAGELVAVMFMDLDKFKNINDTLGHTIGDSLLQAVAGRIQESLRVIDMVARLGSVVTSLPSFSLV